MTTMRVENVIINIEHPGPVRAGIKILIASSGDALTLWLFVWQILIKSRWVSNTFPNHPHS
jgi:hypothetical protein